MPTQLYDYFEEQLKKLDEEEKKQKQALNDDISQIENNSNAANNGLILFDFLFLNNENITQPWSRTWSSIESRSCQDLGQDMFKNQSRFVKTIILARS